MYLKFIKKINGNQKGIHTHLCEMAGINASSTNISSVAKKAELVVSKIKRLKNCRN